MAATLTITTKHNPMAFLLSMTKINLTIDGETEQIKWGTETRELAPGSHQVDVALSIATTQPWARRRNRYPTLPTRRQVPCRPALS